ncbi:phosphate uptake regulator [Fervidobacterium pennivorans DSM 9078]|uniref:Phosphate uptake regulator n=1 Tax=Fervidobacterium pennivorans (strain DSM 9078 / Ven5) TaxID=771875 RepID=H9UAJ4_FERPD|nr:PhoU domain-containing protein [Fervidobacterium pennivorans]AFG34537.1 phosphate uptake regulator [Fervidobacterium pennivorans DSM 9078]
MIDVKWIIKEKLEELKKYVVKEGWYVEDIFQNCSVAFRERNDVIAKEVNNNYWDVYNEYLMILEFSQQLFGMFTPDKRDLRFISGSVIIAKILLDIAARLRDIASDIMDLVKEPDINQSISIPDMFRFSQRMLRKSLRVYVDQNLEGAAAICAQDAQIDESYSKFNEEIVRLIQDNPRVVKRALILMDISKGLEEISDYSVQIIEVTHFIITGKYYTCYKDSLKEFSLELFKDLSQQS